MVVDILMHELVPVHEILSKKDAKEVLDSFGIEKEQLPRIQLTDAIIKKVKAKSGDVVKITRKSPTAGESIYYRIVV